MALGSRSGCCRACDRDGAGGSATAEDSAAVDAEDFASATTAAAAEGSGDAADLRAEGKEI